MSERLLHLLRHGETGASGRLLGHGDHAVTGEGIAACLEQVDGLAIDAILTSNLRRARDCAEAIGATCGIAVQTDPRWRELDFGAWDGRAPAEIGEAMRGFWDDPERSPPPGGERWSSLVARVAAALEGVPEEQTLVVTHGGPMRAVLAHLFGFDLRQIWAIDLPCAALLSIRLWRDGAQIVRLAP